MTTTEHHAQIRDLSPEAGVVLIDTIEPLAGLTGAGPLICL